LGNGGSDRFLYLLAMPAIFAKAPGKIILLGEHAVVYGQPAIAVPVNQVQAKAMVTPNPQNQPGLIILDAPQIHLLADLNGLPSNHPLAAAVRLTLAHIGAAHPPALTIRVTSTIPIAGGLGSGAAVSVAIIRALSDYLGSPLPDDQVSGLAYEVEKIHHTHPSGVDNTVITRAKPVYFQKGLPIEVFDIRTPFTIVIGDTGVAAQTSDVVQDVRCRYESEPEKYARIFNSIGELTCLAYHAITDGENHGLGGMMNANHELLVEMGVSSPELNALVQAARQAGAAGAKLSGAGRGGNMIALVNPEHAETVSAALKTAGAVNTIITTIQTQIGMIE
jgi:mevalonate kinase